MSGNNNAPTHCNGTGFLNELDCGSGSAAGSSGESVATLATAIVGSFGSAGAQVLIFLILRIRLSRIYRPRSYLVPERERVPVPPNGVVGWLKPLFNTPNLAFIQKCGLDAYFFLRYLRMLLKIFLPVAIIVLPILLPLNRYSGDVESGLDRLSISNVSGKYIKTRFWAHLILAIGVILWVCYVLFREFRGYIRVRQAFLTSPQHRIRASSTTVLVTGIPRKWLTMEALNGLYDVFPGGIRNIWINRNFDELATKVSYRDSLAKSLENAETNLIKTCWERHEKAEAERRKKEGKGKKSKEEKKHEQEEATAMAEQIAQGQGISAGDQGQTPHGLQDAVDEAEADERRREHHENQKRGLANPLGLVEGGFEAMGKGLGWVGRGVGTLGQRVAGDVDNGIHKAADGMGSGLDHANYGGGFVTDDALYASPQLGRDRPPAPPPQNSMDQQGVRLVRNQVEGAGAQVVQNKESESQQPQVHPSGLAASNPAQAFNGSPLGEHTPGHTGIRMTGPSIESSKAPKSPLQIEEPPEHQAWKTSFWKVWQNRDNSLALPSPQPHTAEEDAFPLNATVAHTITNHDFKQQSESSESRRTWKDRVMLRKSNDETEEEMPKEEYAQAFDSNCDEDQDGDPAWRRYLEPKDRETMRVPIFSPTWCPSLPLIGKKVDRIYWTRRELARMNLEIEADQNDVEKFPFMSSAFIQFNHQIAAHMACQSVSHHIPQAMAPRIVEIAPDDVLWSNMSIKWWERYIRTFLVLVVCVALIILYAIPVSFTSLLSKVDDLAQRFHFLAWITTLPNVIKGIIQGLLPPIILSIILTLVPIIFRLLVKQQGVSTGNSRERYVQQWYFAFLFIQVFLVVTITGGLTKFFSQVSSNPTSVLNTLAKDLPSGADYFFSYLTVQAVSNSASELLQVGSLLSWFILAPLLDSTARAKWRRQTSLNHITWGSFFPPFTNFAVIGIIYSVIAPLILFFMLIIFALFWIVYRHNVLYVYQFRNDTGGLLFPIAMNQLFTGLYVMELFLVGLFFTKKDQYDNIVCIPQGVIMIVALVLTIAYQVLLNSAFQPLLRYLPITLEDEAVIRDQEFARAQASKFEPLRNREYDTVEDPTSGHPDGIPEDSEDSEDLDAIEEQKMAQIAKSRDARRGSNIASDHLAAAASPRLRQSSAVTVNSDAPNSPWHHRGSSMGSPASPHQTWKTDRWRQTPNQAVSALRHLARPTATSARVSGNRPATQAPQDTEAQRTVGDVLFSGFADELEDLTPEDRDLLVRYAFQHSALRAKRPVVWIPRDPLGVSDDEIRRAQKMSTVLIDNLDDSESGGEKPPRKIEKTNIWMSNEGTALDGEGKVVFRRSPPDFSNVDLIAL